MDAQQHAMHNSLHASMNNSDSTAAHLVVDGVQVVVLHVPRKGGKQHAQVQHGGRDTRDVGVQQAKHALAISRQRLW